MDALQEEQLVIKVRKYVTENLPITQLKDEDLEARIEDITKQFLGNTYCSIRPREMELYR